jgi:hypothetical protein
MSNFKKIAQRYGLNQGQIESFKKYLIKRKALHSNDLHQIEFLFHIFNKTFIK